MDIKGTRLVIQATRKPVEAPRREFRTQLVEVEARVGRRGGWIALTDAFEIKTTRFDVSMSWIVFHLQL
jgi:hypothetical protein